MSIITAFQRNAFQDNAFQIDVGGGGSGMFVDIAELPWLGHEGRKDTKVRRRLTFKKKEEQPVPRKKILPKHIADRVVVMRDANRGIAPPAARQPQKAPDMDAQDMADAMKALKGITGDGT